MLVVHVVQVVRLGCTLTTHTTRITHQVCACSSSCLRLAQLTQATLGLGVRCGCSIW